MIYKILIVKNRYSKKLLFQKCYDWFKSIGIEIIADEICTDFDVTTKDVSNATFKGAVADGFKDKLKSVVPENKYNAVIFVYGNDINGIRVSMCDNTPLYSNTDIIQLAKYDWKTLNHELFHAFFYKANRRGANIVDNMDSYYRDNILDTDNGDTNRTIALKSLKPYWNQIQSLEITMPTVTIERIPMSNETMGTLIAKNNGAEFSCKTLELPYIDNKQNISCIPKGEYDVKWTYSLKFPLGSYEIQKVPNRSGIRFHKGNYAAGKKVDIQGCILLGAAYADINADGIKDIISSTVTVKAFEMFMGKKPFKLTIK